MAKRIKSREKETSEESARPKRNRHTLRVPGDDVPRSDRTPDLPPRDSWASESVNALAPGQTSLNLPREKRISLADFGIDPESDDLDEETEEIEDLVEEREDTSPHIHIEVGEEEPGELRDKVGATPPPPSSIAAPTSGRFSDGDRTTQLTPKMRPKPWWETFFDDDYLNSVRLPEPSYIMRQCNFYERAFRLEQGASIIDIGCGTGAHAIELSERGYGMIAMDLSLSMLSRAADEAQEKNQKINFVHADMTTMDFREAFDGVMCIGTSFGYFDEEVNRQQIMHFRNALKPKGILVLDVVNRDHVIMHQPNLIWFDGQGCVCMEETHFNFFSSRLYVKRTLIFEDGRQREAEYSVRLYSLHELGLMLHHAGFRVLEVSGLEATPGVVFGGNSPRLIIVAERRLQRQSAPTIG